MSVVQILAPVPYIKCSKANTAINLMEMVTEKTMPS